jgi:cell division protein FtsI (penicillin-binding protein 3)
MNRKNFTLRIKILNYIFYSGFIFISIFSIFEAIKKKDKKINNNKEHHERLRILDRNNIEIVTNKVFYDFYLEPSKIPDLQANFYKIIKIFPDLENNKEIILKNCYKKRKKGIFLVKRNLSEEVKKKLLYEGVLGIYFDSYKKRHYSYKNLFSHVIGMVDDLNNGILGIEKAFNSYIKNHNNSQEKILYTTIDYNVQSIIRKQLIKQIEAKNASGGIGILINLTNGEVLSAVSLPDFDPNYYNKYSNNSIFNRFSFGIYELGSIFKLLLGGLAAEENFDLQTQYERFTYSIDGFDIHDAEGKDKIKKNFTLEEGIVFSSNVICAKATEDIGHKKVREFYKKLGLLDKPNFELIETGKPIYQKDRKISNITMSYGHGIATTPLHYTSTLGNIINNCQKINPTFIKNNINNTGKIICKNPEHVSETVVSLMKKIKENSELYYAGLKDLDIAFKTGTSIKAEKGGYNKGMVSFQIAAIYPASNPKYIMLFMIEDVNTNQNSSSTMIPFLINFIQKTKEFLD